MIHRLVLRLRIFSTLILAFFGLAVPARAQSNVDPGALLQAQRQTGIRMGKWMLHPNLSFYETYDTNLLFSDVAPRDDFGFVLTPGVDLILRSVRTEFLLGYRFKWVDQRTLNVQDYKAHSAFTRLSYQFSRRFAFRAAESFEKTSDPADIEIPERIERLTNEASAEVVHRTPAEDLETALRYTHMYQRYDFSGAEVASLSSNVAVTSRVNLASRFRFLPKSTLLLNGEYGVTDFGGQGTAGFLSDSQGTSISAGLSSQFSRKIGASMQGGYSWLFFDSGADTSAFVGSVSANYHPGERFTIEAGYRKRLEQSSFTNYYEERTVNLDATARIARKVDAGVRSKYSFVDFSGPSLLVDNERRKDKLFQTDVTLDYRFKEWIRPRLQYTFSVRDSNASNPLFNSQSADFSRHRISLGVEVYY